MSPSHHLNSSERPSWYQPAGDSERGAGGAGAADSMIVDCGSSDEASSAPSSSVSASEPFSPKIFDALMTRAALPAMTTASLRANGVLSLPPKSHGIGCSYVDVAVIVVLAALILVLVPASVVALAFTPVPQKS